MIARIEGVYRGIEGTRVYVDVTNIWYEVLIPSGAVAKMPAVGETVIFHTLEIIEGGNIGTIMQRRLIGFLERVEKEFLQVFTSVSGLGIRKALKAMQIPVSEIAAAIELGNESVLKGLPDIGPKTAKKIIAELQGKMSKFALLQESASTAIKTKTASEEIVDEARYVLTELLHYSEKEAINLLNLTSEDGKTYTTSEELLQAIFKLRAAKQ
ncbi:MAG: hypothetical protein K8S87_08010 [Planctomycetes bacterium]|nr:hypothetical protein [Planctomycetota bacterium]